MSFAITIVLFLIIGLKIEHGTGANDDTLDDPLKQLPTPPSLRMEFYRRKINARLRRGFFRGTTQKQFQSYDSWGAGGQMDLLLKEYGEASDTEEDELPQEPQDHLALLRSRVHRDNWNAAHREYLKTKLLLQGQNRAKKARPIDFFEPFKYGGHWVYERNVSIRPSEAFGLSTTNRTPLYGYYNDRSCLRPCPLIYKFDYGAICAIRWHRPPVDTPPPLPTTWYIKHLGTSLFPRYYLKNFTNLCEMEVHNCIMLHVNAEYVYSWRVMFRGPCPRGMDDEKETLKDRDIEKVVLPGNPEPLTNGETEIKLANEWLSNISGRSRIIKKAREEFQKRLANMTKGLSNKTRNSNG